MQDKDLESRLHDPNIICNRFNVYTRTVRNMRKYLLVSKKNLFYLLVISGNL